MIDLRRLASDQMEETKKIILEFAWEDRETYAMWLAQTYHMVNHSTRLVALAGALVGFDRNDLHARFIDHSKEERGHQLLVVADLGALGCDLASLPCLYPSAAMYQIQYYWIEHVHPIAFFGYTLALECMAGAFGMHVYERALRAHGSQATKFLRLHSRDDIEHTEKAFEQIQRLVESDRELILENMKLSATLYRKMLYEVGEYRSQTRVGCAVASLPNGLDREDPALALSLASRGVP